MKFNKRDLMTIRNEKEQFEIRLQPFYNKIKKKIINQNNFLR